MISKVSALIAALALSACATTSQPELPKVVPVAVVQPCPAAKDENKPTRPTLATSSITAASSNSEVVKAYLADVLALISYSKQLETSLDSCK